MNIWTGICIGSPVSGLTRCSVVVPVVGSPGGIFVFSRSSRIVCDCIILRVGVLSMCDSPCASSRSVFRFLVGPTYIIAVSGVLWGWFFGGFSMVSVHSVVFSLGVSGFVVMSMEIIVVCFLSPCCMSVSTYSIFIVFSWFSYISRMSMYFVCGSISISSCSCLVGVSVRVRTMCCTPFLNSVSRSSVCLMSCSSTSK